MNTIPRLLKQLTFRLKTKATSYRTQIYNHDSQTDDETDSPINNRITTMNNRHRSKKRKTRDDIKIK